MDENLNLEGNIEIEKALKEFEAKSQVEQMQKTPEVSKTSDVPKMVQLVMKLFGLKEQKQAEYVLLGFVVVAIGVSLFLVFKESVNEIKAPTPDIINMPQSPQGPILK